MTAAHPPERPTSRSLPASARGFVARASAGARDSIVDLRVGRQTLHPRGPNEAAEAGREARVGAAADAEHRAAGSPDDRSRDQRCNRDECPAHGCHPSFDRR
jgi:hypothetical protein